MTSVGWSTLDIIPSVKGLRAELEKQTSGDLTAAGKKGGKRYGDAAGVEAASGFRSRFTDGVRNLNPLAGAAVGASLVLGLKSIVSTASEAQQAVGGVQAVFKDYANEVVADSKNAAQGLGLSAAAYQQLVTVSGALLKNKGLEDFADQATTLVGVGADLAAMFGGTTREAVEALNAALRGESDPIERYAISLGETAINAELAAAGQSALTGAALDQAKTQARLSLIMKQSADAQGAFAREADTAAGAGQRLSAALQDRLAKAGAVTLDGVAALANGLNETALPALDAVGGMAVDTAQAIGSLPAPVKAAAAAFVALRLASATGLAGAAASSLGSVRSGLDSVRLRAMLAADEYRRMRTAQIDVTKSAASFSPAVGRMSSSLGALQTAAQGAGAGVRRGLGGAMSLLGGPWGIALGVGVAALTTYIGKQREAAAEVDALAASLNKQTGEISANTSEIIANSLEKSGALQAARDLGIELDVVRKAAEGDSAALAEVGEALSDIRSNRGFSGLKSPFEKFFTDDQVDDANTLRDALSETGGEIDKARAKGDRLREAMDKGAAVNETTTATVKTYTSQLDDARAAIQKLLDKENERRNKNRTAFDDRTRLAQALADARKEAGEGARTLDRNTQAGRDNRDALSELAATWDSSADTVKNSKGAYEEMRRKFIELADQMNGPGGTRADAKALADQILNIPGKKATEITTPGMRKARRELRELQIQLRLIRELQEIRISTSGGQGLGRAPFPGENDVRPRTRPGGRTNSGPTINIDRVVTPDASTFLSDMQRRNKLAALDGISR